ncbi:MAG TPA: hypothetical protein VFZ23_07860 [Pyrinomonadaceae bacterium]
MGCLFVVLAGFFPRIALLILWVARPTLFGAAFANLLLPILGIVFLPYTTLFFVVLWSPGGLSNLDWVWMVLALLLDLSSYGGSGYVNRDRYFRRRSSPETE